MRSSHRLLSGASAPHVRPPAHTHRIDGRGGRSQPSHTPRCFLFCVHYTCTTPPPLHHHCTTTPLHHYTSTTPLHHCSCTTTPLHHYTTPPHHYTTAPLHHCTSTTSLHHHYTITTPSLHLHAFSIPSSPQLCRRMASQLWSQDWLSSKRRTA